MTNRAIQIIASGLFAASLHAAPRVDPPEAQAGSKGAHQPRVEKMIHAFARRAEAGRRPLLAKADLPTR